MKSKKSNDRAAKPVRTVHELAERIELRFDQLNRVPCGPENIPDTVRLCVTPVFRWTTGAGIARIKPARVIMNEEGRDQRQGGHSCDPAVQKIGQGSPASPRRY